MSEELPRWGQHEAPEVYLTAKSAYRQLGPNLDQTTRMLDRLESAQTVDAGSKPALKKLWHWRWPLFTLAVGSLFWALHAAQPAPPSNQAASAAPEPAKPSAARPGVIEVDPNVRESPESQGAPSRAEAPSPAPASAPKLSVRTKAVAPDPMAELALLTRARRVLASSPERALALTDEHRVQYRTGQLVEERELLAIEALVHLGRHEQARDRAKGFAKRYPNSVHQHRLGVILEGAAE